MWMYCRLTLFIWSWLITKSLKTIFWKMITTYLHHGSRICSVGCFNGFLHLPVKRKQHMEKKWILLQHTDGRKSITITSSSNPYWKAIFLTSSKLSSMDISWKWAKKLHIAREAKKWGNRSLHDIKVIVICNTVYIHLPVHMCPQNDIVRDPN